MRRRKTTTTRTDDCCFRFGRKLRPFHLRVAGYRRLNRIGEQKIIEFLRKIRNGLADARCSTYFEWRALGFRRPHELLEKFLTKDRDRVVMLSMQDNSENSSPTIFMDANLACAAFPTTKRCGYNVSISL
jgi:hypothetical protein